MDILIVDGGFDFSVDFNKQEQLAFELILSQVAFAISMQKKNGVFILKVFDIFLQPTIELIYLLSCFYKQVYIIKPNTSRRANSEKYVVCKYFKYCYEKYKNSVNIITGDGGFDFSVDFNKQEQISGKLIVMQVIYALVMQKYQGHFILKVFDIFTHITIDILFLLSSLYEKVWIIKPNTSRYANSERYIICKNFKIADSSIYYNKCLELFVEYDTNRDMFLHNILNIKPSYLFINRLEDCNAILGQQQLETLSNTINMIDNKNKEKMETIKKNNIQKCINWCVKNKMPYIRSISSTNTFIDNE